MSKITIPVTSFAYACAALALSTAPLLAHPVDQHPSDVGALRWSVDPLVIISLAVSAWLYGRGVRRLWRSAGVDRGVRVWQALAFTAGWAALVIALVSPLDSMGAALFSAHMAQHEILMLVAAPLLVLGTPLLPFLWAMPLRCRERLGRWTQTRLIDRTWRIVTGPLTVWIAHALALWIWHVPTLFQATLESDLVHAAQHSSFFVTAALFWWALIHGRYGRIGYGVAVLYVFTTAVHTSILGALLTFAPRLWYPSYARTAPSWGLSPLEDQQLGGLIMWVPAGLVFIVVGVALFAAWLGESERRVALSQSGALIDDVRRFQT